MDWQRLIPEFWIQVRETDLDWDRVLNEALDAGKITNITRQTVMVNGFPVWIESWPFGYGSLYGQSCSFLPKVATRKRLRKAILMASIIAAKAEMTAKLGVQDND
jgi:hypothetical protein